MGYGRVKALVEALALGLLAAVLIALPAGARTLTIATWANDQEYEMYKTLVANFKAQVDPDLEIELLRTGQGEYVSQITVWHAGGVAPDVMAVDLGSAHSMLDQGILEDLKPWVERDPEVDPSAWPPGIWASTQYNGRQTGLPAQVVSYALGYDKTLFEENGLVFPSATEPLTWNEVAEIGSKIAKDTSGDGETDVWGYGHRMDIDGVVLLTLQNGGRFFNDDLSEVLMDSDEAIEAAEWIYGLVQDGITPPTSVPTLSGGTHGLFLMGSWLIMHHERAAREVGFRWGMAPLMYNRSRADLAYIFQWGMSAHADSKEDAWRFIKWITGAEGQKLLPTVRRIPSHRDAYQAVDPNDEVLWSYIREMEFMNSWPLHRRTGEIQRLYNQHLAGVWTGETPLAQALVTATELANVLVRESQ